MRLYRLWGLGILLAIAVGVPSVKADTTYYYTGSQFTNCTFGSCPSNFTSDYVVASITFASPLAADLPLTVENPVAWTFGDALGTFFYSSATTPTFLTGFPSEGAPPLALSTDSSGNILDSFMSVSPAEVLGISGAAEGGILNPPVIDPQSPVPLASFIEVNTGTSKEWDAVTGTPGTWSMPEPSGILLLGVGLMGIMGMFFHRKRLGLPQQ